VAVSRSRDSVEAQRLHEPDWRGELIIALIPGMRQADWPRCIGYIHAHTIRTPHHRVSALTVVVAHLPDGDRQNVIETISGDHR